MLHELFITYFTLDRGIKILPLTKKGLEKYIPILAEVTVQSLSAKLQDMIRSYPYTMPDWLKIIITTISSVMLLLS